MREDTIQEVSETMRVVAHYAVSNETDWLRVVRAAARVARSGGNALSVNAGVFSRSISPQYAEMAADAFIVKHQYHKCPNYDKDSVVKATIKAVREGIIEALNDMGFKGFDVSEDDLTITIPLS